MATEEQYRTAASKKPSERNEADKDLLSRDGLSQATKNLMHKSAQDERVYGPKH